MQQGPSTQLIPTIQKTSCSGCVYLCKEVGRRGRFVNDNNYYCLSPQVSPLLKFRGDAGVVIELRATEEPITPDWCPFLNTNIKS